jgi:hypothetical protein
MSRNVLSVKEKERHLPNYPDTAPIAHASRTRRQRGIDLSQGVYTPEQEQSRIEGQGKEILSKDLRLGVSATHSNRLLCSFVKRPMTVRVAAG